jgi:hypothetical protein
LRRVVQHGKSLLAQAIRVVTFLLGFGTLVSGRFELPIGFDKRRACFDQTRV